MDDNMEFSQEQLGNEAEMTNLSDTIQFLGELILVRALSPRLAEQQAIAAELARDDLKREERMELIRIQGKSCDKGSAHILAIVFFAAVTVAVVYVAHGNAD